MHGGRWSAHARPHSTTNPPDDSPDTDAPRSAHPEEAASPRPRVTLSTAISCGTARGRSSTEVRNGRRAAAGFGPAALSLEAAPIQLDYRGPSAASRHEHLYNVIPSTRRPSHLACRTRVIPPTPEC